MFQKINWSEVPNEEVTPLMHRKIITGQNIMIANMKFKNGFVVPKHSHSNEQITQVLSGTIRFWLGEDESEVVDLHSGDVLVIPPHLPHKAEMIGDVEEIDMWSPPRQDWIDGTDDYLRK
ncbi:MAG: cupin domain-containing protein [Flavobacteriaceae bacterium]|nr:cupin domain-containing protein [Flavobacteriaceae bacterium]MCY4268482.1 cupin domain-containing protein [Flavobacteriaceae bacterium]